MRRIFGSITILAIFLTIFGVAPVRAAADVECILVMDADTPGKVIGATDLNCTLLTIPDSVTSIARNAFSDASKLTRITIGNGVATIFDGSFDNATRLTSLTIGSGVTLIDDYAFQSASALTSLTIPDSVAIIGEYAFSGANSLTSLTIGSAVTRIEEGAFSDATRLTSITIPNNVTAIGDGAFYQATSLISLTIGNGVTTIGNDAFSNVRALTSLTLGNSVTRIGDYAFESAINLESLVIPNSVTYIGDNAFYGNDKLASLTIGNSVRTIGGSAFEFEDGSALTSLTIPSSVTEIGTSAFKKATLLSTVRFLGEAPGDVYSNTFFNVAVGAKAIVKPEHLLSFAPVGENWYGLIVELSSSGSPTVEELAAASRESARIAEELREAKRKKARSDLTNPLSSLTLTLFSDADCYGVTVTNLPGVAAEITALPASSRAEINQIYKICRKFEVVNKVATSQKFYPAMLQEIGLIPLESKHKSILTIGLRKLPALQVETYAQIQLAITEQMKVIQERERRLAAMVVRMNAR